MFKQKTFSQMSWDQIGQELNISSPYAYTIAQTAIKKLQKAISELSPEDQELVQDELTEFLTK